MLEQLRLEVCKANRSLAESGLVILTWGNVSGINRTNGLVVIKPSGIAYGELKPENMVVVDLKSGKVVGGNLKPSSDTETHLELYRAFGSISGIVHTHSTYATIWAQALMEIPALGTTHADTFYGSVPCTRALTETEINSDYEAATGRVIVETFSAIDPLQIPAVLVASHGPFAWGVSPEKAVQNAIILEEVARMAVYTKLLRGTEPIPQYLLDRHFLRKHGDNAYYGQNKVI